MDGKKKRNHFDVSLCEKASLRSLKILAIKNQSTSQRKHLVYRYDEPKSKSVFVTVYLMCY